MIRRTVEKAANSNTSLLTAEGLTRKFKHGGREINVLRGLDLTIAPKEMTAVLGKSGVGKSTLLHILGTIDKPDSGTVRFEGTDVFSLAERELAAFRNQKIGFIFQFHHLLPEFSALENVMIPAIIGQTARREANDRAVKLLTTMGLESRMTHRPAELSGGEQQRVALARALVMRPGLIIADEPTGNLDETTSEEVHNLFSEVNSRLGVAFLVATHNMKLAGRMHRVLKLEDGRVHSAQTPEVGGGC